MLTCFFVHAEEDVVVVPQSRYRPSANDWHSVDEKLKWEDENPNPRTITFYTEGRFGVNLEEALYGRQEAVGVSVDGEDDVDPNLALHILVSNLTESGRFVNGRGTYKNFSGQVVLLAACQLFASLRPRPRMTNLSTLLP